MRFEFDPAKDEANRAKHKLSLMFGARVFDDHGYAVLSSERPIDGELRKKAVGHVDGRLYTAVHVKRNDAIRLISVRRSNSSEQRDYYSHSTRPR